MANIKAYKQYINGEWVDSLSSERIEVINPVTEEVISSIPKGDVEDAQKALVAARDSQDAWEDLVAAQRGDYLMQIAAVIKNHRVDN